MLTAAVRLSTRAVELLLALPLRAVRVLLATLVFNPRLGPFRHVAVAAIAYVAFAVLLVYLVAPIRGIVGAAYLGDKIRYDSERWLATAIYDAKAQFVGVFDPRLDSERDVNFTDAAIEIGSYVANPDHKSIPVQAVPEHYWKCLVHHEDRYLGGPLNPYGIDLLGVLKIPYSTVRRSLALRRPSLGVGGSTLPMQLVRVIYKTPPSADEGGFRKLQRKLKEWWLAPVLYHELTRGGDDTPLRQWTANHIWLAQRTGGQPLHGVEVTSRIVFGKEAKDLTIAEQFVLASAVNKPIILMTGSDRLNEVRMDRWKYITEVRARQCAERLIDDAETQKKVAFDLFNLAGGPPDPRVRPKLQQVIDTYAPAVAARALANPVTRANALLPEARFAIREEMKQRWGLGWRNHVRGVTTTLDVGENLAFGERLKPVLKSLEAQYQARLKPGYTLDPGRSGPDRKLPHVVVVAANRAGEIVRYYDAGELASYTGSPAARRVTTGRYDPEREPRRIASTGKMLAAIAIANEHHDTVDTLYTDAQAPERGLEACDKGNAPLTRGRKAIVSFACSLNRPIEWRTAQLGQARVRRLIDGFGFQMPPAGASGEATPPSTAAVRGLVRGSPRHVHHMSAVVLAALAGDGATPVPPPTLVKRYDYTSRAHAEGAMRDPLGRITPDRLIRRDAHGLIKSLLQAPLCYQANGVSHGTLKSLASWCADRRPDLRLHFAKTGTDTSEDPSSTVDTWVTGGIQFANGAAYSYVVLVGTGSTREPFAVNLHGAQLGAPLVEVLLEDLEDHARRHPAAVASARPVASAPPGGAAGGKSGASAKGGAPGWASEAFRTN